MNRPRWLVGLLITTAPLVASLAPPRAANAQVFVSKGIAFGTVISGTTTSVAPTASGAASFRIHGSLIAASVLSFSLPTSLARVGGGTALPVSFCTTCAVYRVNNTNPSGGTAFNPNGLLSGLVISIASDIYIWLGASVNPPLNQPAGSYTGTVVMTVAPLL